MKRGTPRAVCGWLLLAVLLAPAFLLQPAAAQNTAEAPPPAGDTSPDDVDGEQGAAPGDTDDNVAEAPAAEQISTPESFSVAGETPAAEGAAKPGPEVNEAEAAVPTTPAADDAPEAPADETPPLNGAEAPEPEDSDSTLAPPPPIPPVPPAPPNAAEGRPAGTGAENLAEGAATAGAESPVAEPPVPQITLPTPGAAAGPTEGYEPPSIALDVPPLVPPPQRPPDDTFMRPERYYLEDRPLPPLDEDETEEELVARNIEEALKLLDLAVEERPTEGVRIPLPSGMVTFKASDAFEFDRRNRVLTFTGNAEIIFDDIAIWADLIEVDDRAATAYARGYVAIQEQDEIIFCDEAYINYDTETLELFWVEGNTGGPRLQGSLFFEAERAYGTFDHLIMEKVTATTCDPLCGAVDEYHLSAHKAHYKRDNSVVLHDVHIYVRSHKIGWLPLLAVPIPREQQYAERESDIQQTYGYNRTEGWFGKFAYTYSTRYVERVSGALLGVVKLDLTEKKGPGLGVRQDFFIPSLGVTNLRTYYQREWPWEVGELPDGSPADPEENFDFSLNQELVLSRSLTGSLKVDRTNRFIPSLTQQGGGRRTNTWNNSFNLAYREGDTSSTISLSHNVNIQGGYTRSDGTQEPRRKSWTTSGNFGFTQEFTPDLTFKLDQQYSANKGAGGNQNLPPDEEGTFQTQLNWKGRRDSSLEGYSAKLSYLQRGIDYDRDSNRTDRNVQIRREQPSFELVLPRNLFNDGAYFTNFRLNIDNLVTGRRSDPESSLRLKALAGGSKRYQFSRASNLNTGVTFEQYFYNDGNSQYVIMPNATYSYDTFDWFRFDTSWRMTYRQGVRDPPVQGDRKTYQQRLSTNLTFTNGRNWRWRLRSGYNFVTRHWDPISSHFDWDPSRTFGITHTFGYNLTGRNVTVDGETVRKKEFTPSRLVGYWRSPYITPEGIHNWFLSFTSHNDIESKFRCTQFDLRYFRRYKRGWSAEILGSYRDGASHPPDFKSLETTKDFLQNFVKKVAVRKVSCCTTVEAGWRSGIHEFYLTVFLNALPQYPGTTDVYRTYDRVQETYGYDQQFLFPVNQMFDDILLDTFGIRQTYF